MIQVMNNSSPHIICSSKIACTDDGNKSSSMAQSSIWYSCPVCITRVCSDCTWARIETPPPKYEEIQEKSQNSTEEDNTSTIDKPNHKDAKDDVEKHSGSTPVPGMVE